MQSSQSNSHPAKSRKFESGNLVLVGMMGSGKTTMGKLLAKHLGKTFADSDEEIQKRTGVTIQHIFDVEGEVGFRQREAVAIGELVQNDNTVLATGGGAILLEQNRVMLQQNGIIIYLKTGVSDLFQRTRHDRNRPLLQTGDPHAKLAELHQQRDPLYEQVADIVIQSGRQGVHALMLRLVNEIEAFRRSGAPCPTNTLG